MLSLLSPYKWLISGVSILVLLIWGYFAIHNFLEHERNIGYQKASAEYNVKLLAAEKVAREKENQWKNKVQEAQNDATLRDQKIDTLSKLVGDTNGLRNTIANLRRKLAESPKTAANKQADTALSLLEECRARYGEVAEAADRHASDVKLLQDSWPK